MGPVQKNQSTSTDTNGQADAAVLIQQVQDVQRPAIHRLIELEVDRLDVVWHNWASQLT
jgi:hypothetical protein